MENNAQENYAGKEDQEDLEAARTKAEKLALENTHIREEFNVQRAKMKELFLQKEELKRRLEENMCLKDVNVRLQRELDESKSELLCAIEVKNSILLEKHKADEEIETLQQFVRETVEMSDSAKNKYDGELRNLQMVVHRLQEENVALRSQMPRDPPTEGSQISLSTVTKSLARKVASQLGADALSLGPDNLEESMRKVNKYAHEEAEVLRSLVVPLEDEIKVLKDKLRDTDDELQKYKEMQLPKRQDSGSLEASCDMCANYETQLVRVQANAKDLEKKLSSSERMLQAQREDLSKEVEFRKEMEEKWNERKEEHKLKVAELTSALQSSQQVLSELKQTFDRIRHNVTEKLSKLEREREDVQRRLNALEKENESLMGKHSKHSQLLQSEVINMPNNVEELHERVLRMHEDLIMARVAQEEAEDKGKILEIDVSLLREQIQQDHNTMTEKESMFLDKIKNLESQLSKYEREHQVFIEMKVKLEVLEKQLEDITKEKKEAESNTAQLRQRIACLQSDLDTSEHVQKDFVLLSQSLQVQLEKIRESGGEVRWQHEEDVDECSGCRVTFTGSKKKTHCRHCGHIFCQSCLTRVVNSGPNQRPSRVCDVCHTLLVPDTPPYFSREPPHTQD
ncbi:rab GTPase-binding effector protein 1 isoform X2 [Cephus cinctus]|uniref:Rab GTPase-binding effector protein 1 isoform X2 n=1 Tax=Cephus cinctus TaxID=211228 RepID=A0AAJ7REW1_CEPCN|nr:rab GTPase-binding effector protein 1 isoform X2 [Cephus cinctus]